MARNTSISLGAHFDAFVQREVQSGRYGSVSEVIRAGLRMLEDEEAKLEAVRSALKAGEQSGWVEDFNPNEHLKSLRSGVE